MSDRYSFELNGLRRDRATRSAAWVQATSLSVLANEQVRCSTLTAIANDDTEACDDCLDAIGGKAVSPHVLFSFGSDVELRDLDGWHTGTLPGLLFGRAVESLLRPQGLRQTVPDQPEPRAQDQNGDAGIGHQPPVAQEEVARLGDHQSPLGVRRLHTQPEEGE
jgi:hypothetical protein